MSNEMIIKRVEQIKAIIAGLHEFNPMMGHRGCRLAVTYPEIAKMQTAAVIRAAINVKKAHPDWNIVPEIMIPLAGDVKELKYVKNFVIEVADAEIKRLQHVLFYNDIVLIIFKLCLVKIGLEIDCKIIYSKGEKIMDLTKSLMCFWMSSLKKAAFVLIQVCWIWIWMLVCN